MAIQALAEFAQATSGTTENIQLSVQTDNFAPQNFSINASNKLLLQTLELPSKPSWVVVSAEGEGTALATISWTYYIKNPSGQVFNISISKKNGQDNFAMNICVQYVA